MKYCPTCKAQFQGEEIFCPHDGTRLLTQSRETPGRLTGSSLNGVVNLEAFLSADHLGELYRGRLLKDGTDIQVRVFHRSYATATLAEARALLNELKTPLPPQILSVAGLFTDQLPHFIAEELAGLSSLEAMLATTGALPWRRSLTLGCKLARALHWLTERGVRPMGVNPAGIYLDAEVTQLRVGDWLLGQLAEDLPAIDATTPRNALPLWADYVAPELLRDPHASPGAAAVFSVGAIIYRALTGRSPLPEDVSAASLMDLETYPPVPSFEGADLSDAPDALIDLLRMSLARDPSRRFQAPAAIIAALSNVLGSSPEEVAPQLTPASQDVFGRPGQTGPMALPAYSATQSIGEAAIDSVGQTEPQHERHTMLGMPAVALSDDEPPPSTRSDEDVPPRVIIDDPGEGRPPVTTAPYGEGVFEEPGDDEPGARTAPLNAVQPGEAMSMASDAPSADEEQQGAVASTAPLNALASTEASAQDQSATEERPPEASTDDTPIDVAEKKTQMMAAVSVQTLAGEVGPAEPLASASAAGPDPVASAGTDGDAEAPRSGSGEASAGPSSSPREAEGGPSIVVADELQAAEGDAESQGDSDEAPASPSAESSAEPAASIVVDAALTEDEAPESDEAPSDTRVSAEEVSTSKNAAISENVSALNIGFVSAARSKDTADVDDGWFSDSEDAWADEALREAQARSRSHEKLVRLIIAFVLLAVFIAIFIFTQNYEPEPEAPADAARSETREPTVDLQRLEAQFEDAMERGALIHPRSNSALEYLTELKRHAPERYDALRRSFVDAADEASRAAEAAEKWQSARDLSGFASQHAPDDAALRERAEAVQARYVATLEGSEPAPDEDTAASAERAPQSNPGSSSPSKTSSPSPAPRNAQPSPQPTPRVDADASFREGRQAYARGDFDAARAAFERTLSASPNHAGANAGLGQILFDQANMREAERYQLRAVQASPANIEYRLQLGTVYFRLERFQDAIRTWEEVLNRDPNNSDAQRFIELAQRRVSSR